MGLIYFELYKLVMSQKLSITLLNGSEKRLKYLLFLDIYFFLYKIVRDEPLSLAQSSTCGVEQTSVNQVGFLACAAA